MLPTRRARARAVLTFLFLTFGLPSWVFLVFASVSALAPRDEAEDLVRRYWLCLRTIAPAADGANASMPSSAYTHADAAASICIASASLLLVSLLMACRASAGTASPDTPSCASRWSLGFMGAATLGLDSSSNPLPTSTTHSSMAASWGWAVRSSSPPS